MAINIPQVGNAPIAPPTQPTLQQEAFTAVLPTTENLNKDIMQASLTRHAMNEAEKQRQQKTIDDHIKMFDFDTVGVWDEGFDGIMEYKDEGMKKLFTPENLKALDSGDGNAWREYSKYRDGILSKIYQEKQAAEAYKQYDKLLNSDQKYKVLDANGVDVNRKALEDWKNQKEHSIGDIPDFTMQIYNPALSVKYVQTLPQVDGSVSTPQSDGSVKTTAIKYTDPKTASDALMAMYNSDPEQQQGILQDMLYIMQNNPDKMINIYQDPKTGEYSKPKTVMVNGVPTVVVPPIKQIPISTATAEQVYIANGYDPNAKGVLDIKQTEGGSGGSGGSGSGGSKPSKITWVVDGLVDIKKGTGQSTEDVKSSEGNTVKFSKMFEGGVINNPINNEPQTIASISHKGGKTYVTFKEEMSSTGAAPLRQIDNEWNQIVIPVIQDKYGDNALEELKQYAIDEGVADVLGIPTLNAPTQSSGTQQQGGVKKDWSKYKRK